MMKFAVYITAEAEKDINDIYSYIAVHDSEENALYVLKNLEESCLTLEHYPQKGHTPPEFELEKIDILTYREIHFKPYRIIYEIRNKKVFVHAVLDGRRDLQSLLERRLFR